MTIPNDFLSLLPPLTKETSEEAKTGFEYALWVFDPQTSKVHVESNATHDHADRRDHSHLADDVPHPDRVHGYAYLLRHGRGFRITDWDHRPLKDPYVFKQVKNALEGKEKTLHQMSKSQIRQAF